MILKWLSLNFWSSWEEEEGGVVADAGEALRNLPKVFHCEWVVTLHWVEADHQDAVGEVVDMVRHHPEDAVAEQEEDVDEEEAEVNQVGGTSTKLSTHIESSLNGKKMTIHIREAIILVFLK